MEKLKTRDISVAVQAAHVDGLLRQPDGVTLCFKSHEITKKAWEKYPWQGRRGVPHDPDASPKPTWEWLVETVKKLKYAELMDGRWDFIAMPLAEVEKIVAESSFTKSKKEYLRSLRDECGKRISAVYGADDAQDEVFVRLRDGADATKDAERDRLRARYAKIKTWAMGVTTKSGFDALDLSAPATWAVAWTPPAAAGRE